MRKTREDVVSDYAAEFAGEGFDKLDDYAWEWLQQAIRADWGDEAFEDCEQIVCDALALCAAPRNNAEVFEAALAKMRKTVGLLKERFIDHASDHGLYAQKADEWVTDMDAAAAEDRWERERDDRMLEAYEAGVRG